MQQFPSHKRVSIDKCSSHSWIHPPIRLDPWRMGKIGCAAYFPGFEYLLYLVLLNVSQHSTCEDCNINS